MCSKKVGVFYNTAKNQKPSKQGYLGGFLQNT